MICRHCQADVPKGELAGHLVGVHHLRLCVLCARRERVTEVETGHCCAVCRVRVDDALQAIVRLAVFASAYVVPGSTGSGNGRSVPESRPPLNVDAVEPEMVIVRLQPDDPTSEEPLLHVLESWCRLLRDERGLSPYGPASARRGSTTDRAVLTDVVRFLRTQVDYATTEPTFGLEQFVDEVELCQRALTRWDFARDANADGAVLACPTMFQHGECGYRLRVLDLADRVHCPRCGANRDGTTLAHIAISAGDGVWLDPVAASTWLGISESTLRRQAREGRIERRAGRYFVRHAPFAS